MGCTSSVVDAPLPRVLYIQPRTLNLCIDQLPLFMIHKLKHKFDSNCHHHFQIEEPQFHTMYTNAMRNGFQIANGTQDHHFLQQMLHQLYLYYTDLGRTKLTFKKFVEKYAMLVKGSIQILSNCLYFLYRTAQEKQQYKADFLFTPENYEKFVFHEEKLFRIHPKIPDADLTPEQFLQTLKENDYNWQESRRKFMLIDKEDIPFEAIKLALACIDISDFSLGDEYYILSSAWYERWAYYYQGIDSGIKEDFKSTKLVKQRSSMDVKRRKSIIIRDSLSRHDFSSLDNTWMIQRPTMITHEDIQGQFRGELKENMKGNQEIRIITKQLWQMFLKTMPAETEYKRFANSISTLDLYPKSIYYLKTDRHGQILDSSFEILYMSLKKTLKDLDPDDIETSKRYYFIKDFGENIWNQLDQDTALGRCSVSNRFFVVETTKKDLFIENYCNRKKSIDNLTYGDNVFTFFGYNKKVMPAYVIRLPSVKKALIHFVGFNFRYETEVEISELSIEEDEAVAETNKKQSTKKLGIDSFYFKGIANIGNTCFINSVIQCLIASPILQEFLSKNKFNPGKQPLLDEISRLSQSLLTNKKVSAVNLKKVIDMEMELFSGYDQHDAHQFFLEIINKMHEEAKGAGNDQTVMDYLFKGKVETSLECHSCSNISRKEEEILSVSLPIPEPDFNTYNIFFIPIYEPKIQKIVLRLHRECSLSDYLLGIEERLERGPHQLIFGEVYIKSFKIRHDLLQEGNRNQLLVKMVNSSSEMHCYERFRANELSTIRMENKRLFRSGYTTYFDYYDSDSNVWLYGRQIDKNNNFEIMNQDRSFSTKQESSSELMKPLGQGTTEFSYKKIVNRRYNSQLRQMELFAYFGISYMIAYPKHVTLAQLEKLMDLALSNFIKKEVRGSKIRHYIMKIFETNKNKCIFCQNIEQKAILKLSDRCCKLSDEQMKTPLIWVAREKQYTIFVDWINLEDLNQDFGNLYVDSQSVAADRQRSNEKTEIEQCLRLYQQPQNVEIECEKCKHREHHKTETMKDVPNILVLHLKEYRIAHDMNLVKMDINLKWIEFLDISRYSVGQKGRIYELYAFIRHHGNSQSGHYTCAIKRKHPFENKKVWVNFDDDSSSMLSDVKNIDSAYLLFFQRVDMPTSGYINFTNL